jgi:hypothetical protein
MSRTADNRRYAVQRTLLILLMGSKCKYCQERRPWFLEFHHLKRPDWNPAKTSRHRRIRLYMRDWSNGVLVLACGTCNKCNGKPEEEAAVYDDVPF